MVFDSNNFSVSLEKKGLNVFLNDAESDIIDFLWKGDGAFVKDVHAALKGHKLSHVTVCVYLDRLYEKGLVDRKALAGKGGLKYWYYTKISREEFGKKLSNKLASVVRDAFGSATANYFMKEAVGKQENKNGSKKTAAKKSKRA